MYISQLGQLNHNMNFHIIIKVTGLNTTFFTLTLSAITLSQIPIGDPLQEPKTNKLIEKIIIFYYRLIRDLVTC